MFLVLGCLPQGECKLTLDVVIAKNKGRLFAVVLRAKMGMRKGEKEEKREKKNQERKIETEQGENKVSKKTLARDLPSLIYSLEGSERLLL